MNVCPFCKSGVAEHHPSKPCPSCGRRANEHPSNQQQGLGPSLGGDGWGDDDDSLSHGSLELGGSLEAGGAAPSSYGGGGVSFGDDDDPFAEDVPDGGALELDLPAPRPPAPSAPRNDSPVVAAAAQSSHGRAAPTPPEPPAPQAQPAAPAPPPGPDPASLIARFPPPPQKVWEAPVYAVKVLWRQLELRQDLASLRKRRSPDVPLYERALKTHDPKAFTLGLTITCAILLIASVLFFLPVILRFVRDPG